MTEPNATAPNCCASDTVAVLSEDDATRVAKVMKALSDPARLRILSMLRHSAQGELCACEFPELLDRTQPTVSHHLKQLVEAGLIQREQRGKWAWFRVDEDVSVLVDRVVNWR